MTKMFSSIVFHVLIFLSSQLKVALASTTLDTPTIAPSKCRAGEWGPMCGQACGQCGGDGTCDRQTGVCNNLTCLQGWKTESCDQECEHGTYGVNCAKQCGHCKNHMPCRHDNGICESECMDEYEGLLCQNERRDSVQSIVGAIFGAGILISVATVTTLVFLWYLKTSKSKTLKESNNFETSADTKETALHPPKTAVYKKTKEVDQRVLPNYAKLDELNKDKHMYDIHMPSTSFHAVPLTEPIYQNTVVVVTK